jgi:ribosomal protein S18 acetylase RimI-like enzyme
MTMADTSTVGEVHVRAWQAAYRGVMPDGYLNGLRPEDRAEMWRSGIEANWPGQRDVITVDGHVAGFAAYGAERESDDPTGGELYAINVHPDYWRRGLGRQLIRHATGELSRLGFATAVLWVEASNDRARRFYEVEGWRFDGTERTDTVEGAAVDEVRYGRELGDRSAS